MRTARTSCFRTNVPHYESYRLAVGSACVEPAGGWALGQSYNDTHVGLVKTQLAKAGVRLAAMLNPIRAPR